MIKRNLIRQLSLLFLVLLFLISTQAFTQEAISWKDAHKYYGEYVTVEGWIVATYNSGKACFLNFHENYKKYFTVVIFQSDYYKFPDNPEDHYYNKKVHVTGIVKEYQGKPEIILEDPSNIEIVEEKEQQKEVLEISWEDADEHYGEYCTVKGKIVATFNSGKACFLNFHKNWKRYFTAVIFASDFHKFPDSPEEYYLDKEVKVTGIIKKYQGKPEIILDKPEQIEVIK